MKRLAALASGLGLIAGIAPPAAAQEQPVRLGLAAGATYSDFAGDAVAASDWRWGFYGGLNLSFFVHHSWSFEIEVNYLTGLGADSVVFSDDPSTAFDYRLSYIEIPLVLKFAYRLGSDWRLDLYSGIDLMLNISCREAETVRQATETDCGDQESPVSGIPFGGGFGYDFGPGTFIGDGRFHVGLSDVFTSVAGVKNKAWHFSGRVEFPIG